MENAGIAGEKSVPNNFAAPHALENAYGELLQLVSFRVGDEEFALDILRVQEIIRVQQLTRVPNSADFVDGVINLRGKVIPVVALRKRFGLAQIPHSKKLGLL